MGFKSWLGFEGGTANTQETVDLDGYLNSIGVHEGELLDEGKYTYIKSISAVSPDIYNEVEKELRKGNLVILDTETMSNTNRLSLKKLIGDLKNLETEIDGDMGRISESKILIVPSTFRILKRKFD